MQIISRPNCCVCILCLYVPGFQKQVFKHVKNFSERSMESKEQKKNKGSVLVAESAYNAQNAQFDLVMRAANGASVFREFRLFFLSSLYGYLDLNVPSTSILLQSSSFAIIWLPHHENTYSDCNCIGFIDK